MLKTRIPSGDAPDEARRRRLGGSGLVGWPVRGWRAALALTVGLLLVGVMPSAAAGSPTDLMSQALQARAGGKTDRAIELLRAAVAIENARPQHRNLARLMLGDTLMEQGRYREALPEFTRLRDDPSAGREAAEAAYKVAQCHGLLGDWATAQQLARELIRKHPDSPYVELARALQAMPGRPDPVIEASSADVVARPAARPETGAAAPVAGLSPSERRAGPERAGPVAATGRPSGAAAGTAVAQDDPELAGARQRAPTAASTVSAAVPVGSRGEVIPIGAADPTPTGVAGTVAAPAASDRAGIPAGRGTATFMNPELTALLTFPTVTGAEQEALATRILQAQNHYDLAPHVAGRDHTLYELASMTARFGELVEACKKYDQLLHSHPQSEWVEPAYFEAIRIRARLGVDRAAISWAEAYLELFPTGRHRDAVALLLAHVRSRVGGAAPAVARPGGGAVIPGSGAGGPQAGGRGRAVRPPNGGQAAGLAVPSAKETAPVGSQAGGGRSTARPGADRLAGQGDTEGVSAAGGAGGGAARSSSRSGEGPAPTAAVAGDPRYRSAKRLMDDGRYELALLAFDKLRGDHPADPGVLWHLALVQVQQEQFAAAAATLERLVQLQPDSDEVRSLLAYAHFQNRDLDQAAADYRQAGSDRGSGLAIYDSESALRRLQRQRAAREAREGAGRSSPASPRSGAGAVRAGEPTAATPVPGGPPPGGARTSAAGGVGQAGGFDGY